MLHFDCTVEQKRGYLFQMCLSHFSKLFVIMRWVDNEDALLRAQIMSSRLQ